MSISLGLAPASLAPRSTFPDVIRPKSNIAKRLPQASADIRSSRTTTVYSGGKRNCGGGGGRKATGRQHARRVYLGAPRCSRTGPCLLPPMFDYKSFGRSSDGNFNKTLSLVDPSQFPNPYVQIAKTVKQVLQQKKDTASPSSTPKLTGSSPTWRSPCPGLVKVDIVSTEGSTTGVKLTAAGSPRRVTTWPIDDQAGDLCDDEEEVSRELSSNENSDEARLQFETYKTIHRAKMEEICKDVQPRRLLRQLQRDGYLTYNYLGHARCPPENSGSTPISKRPTEKLLTLLSIY